MADDNAYGGGHGNGRTPSPRRDAPPAEYREQPREQRDQRDYRSTARSDDSSFNPGNNLHIRGLHPNTTEQDLEDIFGKFGALEKVQIMLDPRTREPRGFAFVTFVEVEPAQEAAQALNGTNLDGRSIIVEKAKRGRARTPTPGQYQGPEKNRLNDYRGGGGYGGDRRGGDFRGGPPPRRYDDRDDRRGPPRGGDRDRDYPPRRYDDRPPRRDFDERGPPRREYDDRAPPRRDYDRRDEEPRRERRDYPRDDAPSRRY